MEPSLLEAKAAFSQWHSQGSSRRHVPMRLKKIAVALQDNYSPQVICRSLGITPERLRYWSGSIGDPGGHADNRRQESTKFIPLRLVNTPDIDKKDTDRGKQSCPSAPSQIIIHLPKELRVELVNQSARQSCKFICELIKEINHDSLNR